MGPPGAGKTTVARLLQQQDGNVRVQTWPDFRKLGDSPFFVRNVAELSPTFVRLLADRKDGGLTCRDAALMTILSGWWRNLERLAMSGSETILLEEGAICLLAKLRGFGAGSVRGEAVGRWWNEIYRRWAATLDLIIVLEAPVPVLLQRIRGRDLQYEIGEMTDGDAMAYLAHIGESERSVLSALAAVPGGPRIIGFDTEVCPVQQIDLSQAIHLWTRWTPS